ncbi:ArsA family ATPase [Corynebacterium testudinoris]|uniref:Arsenite efflux ATP-binding protein ArsA n=1 Tax=Corynebacterium testudinoris TaxID=136857 RepID=A0A0G3HCS6_9CORY|nr:ArsA family ATPase [Corynebacterium testudinoris]AKK09738.1 arsenite efflux ATP-binding protein ArsA [Corynebacterium testudinoris]MBX8996256.1 ArsA family ATPase [Corynebacterium testudinoris]
MLLDLTDSTRVIFFGGKGGVGKTTVASATATALAQSGKKVLLVSTDPAHNLGHLWERRIGDRITTVRDNLDVIELDPAATTAQHLKDVGHTIRGMMPEHLHGEVKKHLELAAQSPGTHEAAILERIASLVDTEADNYDHVVFDTAPSGHTSRLMALPELMAAWTDGLLDRRAKSEHLSSVARGLAPTGRDHIVTGALNPVDRRNQQLRSLLLARRARFEKLRSVLTDPQQCVFFIVLTAERLPVQETHEFYRELRSSGVRVGGCIVNRRSPVDQGDFLAHRHALEEQALRALSLNDVPVVQLPLQSGEITGLAGVEEFAALLR